MNKSDNTEVVWGLEMSAQDSQILMAIIGSFIFLVLVMLAWRLNNRRFKFLIIGLNESGKTTIFMNVLNMIVLVQDRFQENVAEFMMGNMRYHLVDIPSDYRLRKKSFQFYKKAAKGIIFVVDSVTVHNEKNDIAHALYTILSDSATVSCPFLVICNKQDLTAAKEAPEVKEILEKELTAVRDMLYYKHITRGYNTNFKFVGINGKDFEFSQIKQDVQFYEVSAEMDDMYPLSEWILHCCE